MIPLYVVAPFPAGAVPSFPAFILGDGSTLKGGNLLSAFKKGMVFSDKASADRYAKFEAARNPHLMYYMMTSAGVIQASAAPIQSKKFNEAGELLPE